MANTSEVKVLRLKVGDFIIAKVSELKDKYTMEKPMALGFVGEGQSGQGQLQFAPWFPFTCLLYTSPSPRDYYRSRMPASA